MKRSEREQRKRVDDMKTKTKTKKEQIPNKKSLYCRHVGQKDGAHGQRG
jgi:hypothetical protein